LERFVTAVAEQQVVTLSDLLARLEWALEALGDGETSVAVDVLLDLRDELLGVDQKRVA
jgi:hypothetical protein